MTTNVVGSGPQQQYVPLAISGQTPAQEPVALGSAGNVGSLAYAARADHVHPPVTGAYVDGPGAVGRNDVRLAAMGLGGQTFDIFTGGIAGGQTLATDTLYGSLIGLLNGDVVTNLFAEVQTAGSGSTPNAIYLGLYSIVPGSSTVVGTLLAQTANVVSNGTWTTGGTHITVPFALSSAYTVTKTAGYYICILADGTWGTTQLQVGRGSQSVENFRASSSYSWPAGLLGSAGSTLPSSPGFISTSSNGPVWFGWS